MGEMSEDEWRKFEELNGFIDQVADIYIQEQGLHFAGMFDQP